MVLWAFLSIQLISVFAYGIFGAIPKISAPIAYASVCATLAITLDTEKYATSFLLVMLAALPVSYKIVVLRRLITLITDYSAFLRMLYSLFMDDR